MSWLPSKRLIVILSGVLSLGIFLHLIGVYLYTGGHFAGLKGGRISIGLVQTLPNVMNPFKYGENVSADFVYRLLFRGLIRYDVKKQVYVGDITNCDIADITKIQCTINENAIWSDGTKISKEDIVASFKTFKEFSPNEKMRGFLAGVTISPVGNAIEIRAKSKSTLMIDLLTYPIVRTDVIEAIRSDRISQKTYITSGPYVFGDVRKDETYGFDLMTLVRNEKYTRDDIWLDRIVFMFFDTLSDMMRSAETLTVIIPPTKQEHLELSPRFREYTYSNYEYFSVFFNTKRLKKTIRNSLHWHLSTSMNDIIKDEDTIEAKTFFSTGGDIVPDKKLKNFSDIMREAGYQKKRDIINKIASEGTTVSGEASFTKNKYWRVGSGKSTVFFDNESPELLLSGIVPANTQSITINGYTLKEFAKGNTRFAYRVKVDAGTLKRGKNIYTLKFGDISEVLTLYWSPEKQDIEAYKKIENDAYNATQNTPALIADRQRKKEETIKHLESLSDEYYYNDDREPFSLKIAYIVGPQGTESHAQIADNALKLIGVKTELIAYGPKEMKSLFETGKKEYDIFITGISVDGSIANIGRFFEKGASFNFSNYSNPTLDRLFSDLKPLTDTQDIQKIESKILKIFNTHSFFFPLSSPVHRIYIDRNIKRVSNIKIMPDIPSFADIFGIASIKEVYIRTGNKSIGGFFSWLKSQF